MIQGNNHDGMDMIENHIIDNSNTSKIIQKDSLYQIDCRYKDGPSRDEFPMFESLKLTIDRTLPYWNDVIVPQVSSK